MEILEKQNNIFVDDSNGYVRFIKHNGEFMKLSSDDGVYVTEKLAKNKGYKIGDKISWHIMEMTNIMKAK